MPKEMAGSNFVKNAGGGMHIATSTDRLQMHTLPRSITSGGR
jgi:hypothetical protein